MVYQPEVGFLIGIMLHSREGSVNGMEDVGEGDIIRW